MRCVDELSEKELRGARVLVRAGLDVALDARGNVIDELRVERSIPTLELLVSRGARVIILSHIGREPSLTNEPVARALKEHIDVHYVPSLSGHVVASALSAMRDGDVVLLENLRQEYDREKKNDEEFARELASMGDMYVNDAFSNSHRAHASMVGLPRLLPAFAGLLLKDEVAHLSRALDPEHPALAIIGGAKFETKDPVIRSFLKTYDHVAIVGAIANDILRVKGYPTGRSLVSEHAPGKDVVDDPRVICPVDVTVEDEEKQARVKRPEDVEEGDKIVDMGPDTVHELAFAIQSSRFIIWNGPSGLYEAGYTDYTVRIAELIAESDAIKVIGGGDTLTVLKNSGMDTSKLGFLSTGGGAMLEYLLKGSLPAIDALG